MEIQKDEELNPIRQDTTKTTNTPRFFKYRDGKLPFNYGCIPRTWESPNWKHEELGCFGDDDPLDVVELSASALPVASIHAIRLLGIIALIDQGELDWKVLAIRCDLDEDGKQMHDEEQDEHILRSRVPGVLDWFRNYKIAEGKSENTFGFNETILDASFAARVVQETHEMWSKQFNSK
jgi:inorganic pyrophosphatase